MHQYVLPSLLCLPISRLLTGMPIRCPARKPLIDAQVLHLARSRRRRRWCEPAALQPIIG